MENFPILHKYFWEKQLIRREEGSGIVLKQKRTQQGKRKKGKKILTLA